MKILVNNFIAFKAEAEKATKYPLRYFCQVCNSEIEIEENDISVQPTTTEGIKGKGFVCPCCQGINITG
jgi:hypothetical protein